MFTSTRRLSSVLAAMAAVSLACMAVADYARDAFMSGLGVARSVVLEPFSIRPPREPQDFPPAKATASRQFAHRMPFSRRPTVSPGWRMAAA